MAALLDRSGDGAGGVLRWLYGVRHGSWAETVAVGGDVHAQGLVRSVGVVDASPGVEGRLGVSQVPQIAALQHLQLQGAMETLVLALGLRMVGPAVDDADVEVHQPDA